MRSGRSSSAWAWMAGSAGLAALVAGCWWLLAEQTRGAEIAAVLVLPVAIVTLVVAVLPKEGAGRQVEALEPAFRELVSFLNRLFSALGMNVASFADRHGFQPGTVHKILTGEEFPPFPFLDALIDEVRNVPEAERPRSLPSILDLSRESYDLHAVAAVELNSTAARVERLQRELSAAEGKKNSADRRIAELSKTLNDMEAERKDLMKQVSELERKLLGHLAAPLMIETEKSKKKAESRRDSIDRELTELRANLEKEKKARIEAENVGAQLRDALTKANSRLVRSGGSPVDLYAGSSGSAFLSRLSNAEMRWSGSGRVSAAGIISLVYFGPVYLGLVYDSSNASVLVKLSTLCGLATVVWIAYIAGAATRAGIGSERNLLIRLVAVIAALFFLGVFIQAVL
jgi:hypothetical protein